MSWRVCFGNISFQHFLSVYLPISQSIKIPAPTFNSTPQAYPIFSNFTNTKPQKTSVPNTNPTSPLLIYSIPPTKTKPNQNNVPIHNAIPPLHPPPHPSLPTNPPRSRRSRHGCPTRRFCHQQRRWLEQEKRPQSRRSAGSEPGGEEGGAGIGGGSGLFEGG